MSVFEIIMLTCFGISWPISVLKSIRTHHVTGKSPLFMMLIAIGSVSGALHKYYSDLDWVIVLYIFNLIMVLLDLALYLRYAPARGGEENGSG